MNSYHFYTLKVKQYIKLFVHDLIMRVKNIGAKCAKY